MASSEPTRSGIYAIHCAANGTTYIGSASNLVKREQKHRSNLNLGNHHCGHLQNAWSKHGPDAFEWSIIEYVPIGDLPADLAASALVAREQYHLDTWAGPLFNVCPTAGSALGRRIHDAESKARMSDAVRRSWQDPESRARRLAAMNKPATLAKLSVAKKGKKHSEQHRANLAASLRTPAIRAKRADFARGRNYSEETRAKLSAATREHYRRLREAAEVPTG